MRHSDLYTKKRRKTIAQWILAGSTPAEIAEAFGIAASTVQRVMKSPEYEEKFDELQTLAGRAISMRMSLLAPDALTKLHDLMNGANSQNVQLKAATTLLEKVIEPKSPYAPQRQAAKEDPGEKEVVTNLTQIIIQAYEAPEGQEPKDSHMFNEPNLTLAKDASVEGHLQDAPEVDLVPVDQPELGQGHSPEGKVSFPPVREGSKSNIPGSSCDEHDLVRAVVQRHAPGKESKSKGVGMDVIPPGGITRNKSLSHEQVDPPQAKPETEPQAERPTTELVQMSLFKR